MLLRAGVVSRYALYVVIAALPCILLFTSLRTLQELDQQKEVYLRQRAAEIAGALETHAGETDPTLPLLETEPNLRDLVIIDRNSALGRQPVLQPIWEGHQLYHTAMMESEGRRIYRAYVPFHGPQGLRIAQIDLDGKAADFLLVHARHNVFVSVLGGIVLIGLSGYAVWLARRSSELERRQAVLEHLARLGRLAATLAHEIRNPLGTIKGFTQLAVERTDSQAAELLNSVLRETQRLEHLVSDLLTYGRPPEPTRRAVFWPEIADELEQHVRTLASGRPIRLWIDKDPVNFTTDPDLLRQIFLNLLRNALDAVKEEPTPEIGISLLVSKGKLAITLSDNGPGIAPELEAKVFEPFFSTKAFGTGLGLAISEQLARLLEGSLEVRNRSPHGVEVVLTLRNAKAHREQLVTAG
ncbi:MAG TPA: ATP-binding protein [Terriglobales bacterium]|nr:ATP-binding protein [Terriglobales bacterium]